MNRGGEHGGPPEGRPQETGRVKEREGKILGTGTRQAKAHQGPLWIIDLATGDWNARVVRRAPPFRGAHRTLPQGPAPLRADFIPRYRLDLMCVATNNLTLETIRSPTWAVRGDPDGPRQ